MKAASNIQRRLADAQRPSLPAWTPFQPGVLPPINPAEVRDQAAKLGRSYDEIMACYEDITKKERVFVNSRYQVNMREIPADDGGAPLVHLSIKRRDKATVHDWRDLQRIKNELCGPEREAVEIYPAESRLVDTANQYHLWVLPEGSRVPFGFDERLVTETPGGNSVQRPFEP